MDYSGIIEDLGEREYFAAGSRIFSEGEPAEKMYLILSGQVRLSIAGEAMAMEFAGGFIGEMALIDQRPRSATATALQDCELAPLNRSGFLELIREQPEFALHVMSGLAERVRLANEILSAV